MGQGTPCPGAQGLALPWFWCGPLHVCWGHPASLKPSLSSCLSLVPLPRPGPGLILSLLQAQSGQEVGRRYSARLPTRPLCWAVQHLLKLAKKLFSLARSPVTSHPSIYPAPPGMKINELTQGELLKNNAMSYFFFPSFFLLPSLLLPTSSPWTTKKT